MLPADCVGSWWWVSISVGGVNDNEKILELLHSITSSGDLSHEKLEELATFNSGYGDTIGIRFTKASSDRVIATVHVSDKHQQITGIVNGGVYCSIAETVGSVMGIIASRGGVVVGVNNNTDFLKPVTAGVIEAEATVIRAGKTTQLINVDMSHRGSLVARTTLRTMVMPKPANSNPGRRQDKFSVGSDNR